MMNVTQLILEDLQEYIYHVDARIENGAYFLAREPERTYLSYSKWAAEELTNRILAGRGEVLSEVLEEFIRKMEDYSTKRAANTYMFAVALDFALDIYDLYCLPGVI